jgi:3-deoxy-7-phosphoheptulonate synthase
MLIVLKQDATQKEIDHIIEKIHSFELTPHISKGEKITIITVIGDEDKIRELPLVIMPGVDHVKPIMKPYKLVSRDAHSGNTIVKVGDIEIGGKKIVITAGPCSVEGEKEVIEHAKMVKKAGAHMFRAGAFKPRTSPYSFQGFGAKGLEYLSAARAETGLAIVTEVMDVRDVELVAKHADVLQVGTRNMQNFNLLKEVGKINKPVILKRGMSSTIVEFLMSAEYIMSEGNQQVILCPRGIRTFEDITRNTLDAGAIPVIKDLSHLPVVADPSHAMGITKYVPAAAMAYLAAGADGLLIEVHPEPENAMSDGQQSLDYYGLVNLIGQVSKMAVVLGREI